MTQKDLRYEPVDHPADVGIRVFGPSRAALFENAAHGLFDTITDIEKIEPALERTIELDAADVEDLFVHWLSELNYLFQTEQMLFASFEVKTLSATGLSALLRGERRDPRRHEIDADIKGVTFHDLDIRQTPGGWEAEVIFDV